MSRKTVYRVSEFAAKVGLSANTIRRMDEDGRYSFRKSVFSVSVIKA